MKIREDKSSCLGKLFSIQWSATRVVVSKVKTISHTYLTQIICWAATSLGCLVVCVCVSIERSTIILAFLFEVCRLFGFLTNLPFESICVLFKV
jgi:hypothetical protein